MPRKKLLLVYNPFSGKGGITRALHEIISIFTADGFDVTAHPTSRSGEGRDFIAEYAEEYDLVCSSGGDGMLHELFEGMKSHSRDIPCGYLPAGTMNDFAASIGLPLSLTEAADTIVRGNFKRVDAGMFNNERFAYVAAFGAFSEISYSTDQQLKSVFGSFAYFIEGVKLFDLNYFSDQSAHLRITANGKTVEGDFVFGMAGNTLSVAGMTKLVPEGAAMDDGLLDCLFIRTPRHLSDLEKIRAAAQNEQLDNGSIIRIRTEKLLIESDRPLSWDLDGEFGGECDRAEISAQKKAMLIAAPTADSAAPDYIP